MKLSVKASPAERDAAFDVVYKRAEKLIDDWIPWLFQSQARNELNSPKGRKTVLEVIDEALDAADAVRAKEHPPK